MKLYTRRGDEGETGLFLGGRVSKADLRIEACGAADTAVSAMGLARAICSDPRVKEILLAVQRQMFTVGAELATGLSNIDKLDELVSKRLELDRINDAFEEMKQGRVARSVIVF